MRKIFVSNAVYAVLEEKAKACELTVDQFVVKVVLNRLGR